MALAGEAVSRKRVTIKYREVQKAYRSQHSAIEQVSRRLVAASIMLQPPASVNVGEYQRRNARIAAVPQPEIGNRWASWRHGAGKCERRLNPGNHQQRNHFTSTHSCKA
jgi:hypothetical protein